MDVLGMESAKGSELRSRVFISCGQSKSSDEVAIAAQIKDKLYELGFDPYVAVQEQSLRGLKENIFEQLSKSEYLVFVDFKREQLGPTPDVHRGSLFCHQELAIASYLEIPVLAFQEQGVKTGDGILGFIQANATPFHDRYQLPSVIAEQVQRRKEIWDPRWRNELVLERDPTQYSRTQCQDGRWCWFFHVGVRNRHRSKTARDCYAYLEKATRLNPNADIPVKQVEFGWAGYSQPNAHVFPGRVRAFDAFYILEDLPTQLQFNVFATGSDFVPRIGGQGGFQLVYSVVSENFPEARASLVLTLDASLDRTTIL
jgi:hypothetical protein